MDSRVEGSICRASLSSTSAERVYAGGATPIKHGDWHRRRRVVRVPDVVSVAPELIDLSASQGSRIAVSRSVPVKRRNMSRRSGAELRGRVVREPMRAAIGLHSFRTNQALLLRAQARGLRPSVASPRPRRPRWPAARVVASRAPAQQRAVASEKCRVGPGPDLAAFGHDDRTDVGRGQIQDRADQRAAGQRYCDEPLDAAAAECCRWDRARRRRTRRWRPPLPAGRQTSLPPGPLMGYRRSDRRR